MSTDNFKNVTAQEIYKKLSEIIDLPSPNSIIKFQLIVDADIQPRIILTQCANLPREDDVVHEDDNTDEIEYLLQRI